MSKKVSLMKILIYLIPLLYVINPYDILPDFLIGIGWIDDLIILGALFWYHFIYRPNKIRVQYENTNYQKSEKSSSKNYQENQERVQTESKFSKSDPYEVLGIDRKTSLDEIKQAYRKLALKYHPDRVDHLGDEFRSLAEQKFKEIHKAYRELADRYS